MPTAAKLVAAVAFGLIAWFAAEMFKQSVTVQMRFGWFSELCAGIGVLCGWIVMGPLSGRGYQKSIGYGVRTAVTFAVWALLGFSIYQMVLKSTKMLYDGPMQALVDIFGLMLENGIAMMSPGVLGVLFVGGVFGGWLTEWAARRWS
ncbi:MAG: TrgA family protein [Paracoccaceae bacterium]|nr:TrgA family protein [Paracoccaceae bacterium]